MSAFKGDIRSEDTVICSVEPSRNVNRLQWVLILDIFILKKFKTVVATPQGVFPSAHFSKRKVFTEQWVKKQQQSITYNFKLLKFFASWQFKVSDLYSIHNWQPEKDTTFRGCMLLTEVSTQEW